MALHMRSRTARRIFFKKNNRLTESTDTGCRSDGKGRGGNPMWGLSRVCVCESADTRDVRLPESFSINRVQRLRLEQESILV